ncbi:TrbC/VirB2 family protein [Desertibaculum subflavum]|uniref:TrbC/VirB2 family protein n=1 Tax=Desertibaculum subflavum TaxID=2268458 RepID=UPI0013C4FEFC
MLLSRFLACAIVAALICISLIDASLAQDPFGSITTKANQTRDHLVTIGQAVIGVVAAALFIMAAFGRVQWYWVGMAIVAGAGLTGIDAIQAWINA